MNILGEPDAFAINRCGMITSLQLSENVLEDSFLLELAFLVDGLRKGNAVHRVSTNLHRALSWENDAHRQLGCTFKSLFRMLSLSET